MLVNTLKSNQPFVIVLILLTSISLWIFSFIDSVAISIPSDQLYSPFYNFINNHIDYNSFLSAFITLILVLLQAFILVQFNKKHILINYRTYLPAYFYLLVSSSFVQLHRLNPVIIGTVFVFISINFLFNTYRTDYALNKIYLAGFFISVASLFWAPMAIFILLIWISLLILRPFIGREWLVGLLGFLTPFLFIFVFYYVFTGDQLDALLSSFLESFAFAKGLKSLHFTYYIFYGFLSLILLLASYTIVANYQKKKIKNRKYFEINWWFFILSLGLFLIFKNVTYEIIYLITIPISFLLTDYFYTIRKAWYLNAVLIVFYSALVYIQITAH